MTENLPETTPGDPPALPVQADPGPYAEAVEEYLDAQDWLTAVDAPFKVHARKIASSLDQQLARTGEVQSALASSFDKVLVRLEARRPPPAPRAPSLTDPGPMGEQSVFEVGFQ